MKQFFKFMLASMLGTLLMIGTIFIIFIGIIGMMVSSIETDKEVTINHHSVLKLDFTNPIPDRSSGNPFSNFNFETFENNPIIGLNQILENIKKAKVDDHIDGILLNSPYVNSGFATVEEIRNALIDFKSSGKFILSYAESYSQGGYYLASISDEIHMNPAGYFEFIGIGAQLMFFKGAMDKLEIQPQVFRHGKFKSAIEPFILDKMSEENRIQSQQFIGSFWNHIVSGISSTRALSVEKLNEIADKISIRNANHALEFNMIDKVSYQDEVLDVIRAKTGIEEINFVKLAEYRKVDGKSDINMKIARSNKIAVIYASGEITGGKSTDESMGSETILKAIQSAREDEDVKAVVLRVNSPGGSALASEVIWREMELTKAVKPVVVSMGNYAASGGYYISCNASKIVANENTITGSIGVFGLVPNMKEMFNNKLGITFDTINTNKHSDMNTVFRPLGNYEKAVIQSVIEKIYDDFITHVAQGRNLTKAQVDSIGQGRVWSGSDALKIGLIDEIGGLERATEVAVELAGLDSNHQINVYPKKDDPFKSLFKGLTDDVKTSVLKSTFGNNLVYYKQMEGYINKNGIYARLPFDYIFN